ncbi:hypothetical protein ABIC09_004906 [Bradyrhizobium sp. S3.12.5]
MSKRRPADRTTGLPKIHSLLPMLQHILVT